MKLNEPAKRKWGRQSGEFHPTSPTTSPEVAAWVFLSTALSVNIKRKGLIKNVFKTKQKQPEASIPVFVAFRPYTLSLSVCPSVLKPLLSQKHNLISCLAARRSRLCIHVFPLTSPKLRRTRKLRLLGYLNNETSFLKHCHYMHASGNDSVDSIYIYMQTARRHHNHGET